MEVRPNEPDFLFGLIPIAVVLFFAWNYYKRWSLTGALLGARVTRTVREITVASSGLSSTVITVHALETQPGVTPKIALALVSKAPIGASMVLVKLSGIQAGQLIDLLQKATVA
jgi:hypothetical protein